MHFPDSSDTVLATNPYVQAKVDHYLEKTMECIQMARYGAAEKMLAAVFALEPGNKAGYALQRQIEAFRAELASSFSRENGHGKQLRRGEIVLVVDQDERILKSLSASLRKYGFGAVGAASFAEAVEVLSRLKPGLIVSEVNFENGPVGYDLYLWVRHNEELFATPFLYLATRVTREMLIAGKRMGVEEFIVKPLDEEVVMASILHCLAKRKKRVA